jgi:hypothetical protein
VHILGKTIIKLGLPEKQIGNLERGAGANKILRKINYKIKNAYPVTTKEVTAHLGNHIPF